MDWGDNGPTLLMSHGDMRTGRSWDAVARDLYADFHVISVDARGHGDSDWPAKGYRYDDRVEDLAALCSELGLRDVIGVGHSSGGGVVALVAERYPEYFHSLVLLEPVIIMEESFQRRISQRAGWKRSTWATRDELRERLKNHSVAGRWREDVIEDIVKHEAMELPDGSIDMKWSSQTMAWEEREGDYFDLRPGFRANGFPILFIVSSERVEGYTVIDPLIEELPGAQKVVIENSGHNMYMERPDAVAHAIRVFSNGHAVPSTI